MAWSKVQRTGPDDSAFELVFQDSPKELPALLGLRTVENRFGQPKLQHTTRSQESDTIRRYARETHLMRHEDKINAFFVKLLDHIQDFGRHFGIQRRSRLIEEHDLWFDSYRSGDCYSLPLSARESRRLLVGMAVEPETIK